MSNFVHLHVHSEYSLLDGANRIKDIPVRAKELGMNAIAITDHGCMYGAIEFYKECKKNEIKPIIGCEVYTATRTRFDKEPNLDSSQGHLILLAKNEVGYKNLIKIVSLGFTEGFYYKPRIDMEVIRKYRDGLICLSACLSGDINKHILNGNYDKAKELALEFRDIFGDGNFYLELQHNGIADQVVANQKLIQISRETGIPLVATNDAHYLKKEDAYNHEVLLCIQTGKKMNDETRMRFPTDAFYVKSQEEMIEDFKNIPEAIENTFKIADMCNLEFEFHVTKLPNYDVPNGQDHTEYFKQICYGGLEKKYRNKDSLFEVAEQRLEYELDVITKMGYVDYYLIVWDFIDYARSVGIPVGPGRGSGAGSIAAYCMGITDIEPIKYDLLFERFLNPERISMPDFDIDFCYERRQEIIDYVGKKYGQDHVAQIITFGTMAARGAIRDVGRVLDIPYAEVDRIAKLVPFELHMTIEKALKVNPELNGAYESDEQIKKLIDISKDLEGLPRHASTHAAGVVITKDPVDTYVPLYVNDDNISTEYNMTILEELGLLKMDFLGLRTLTVIQDAKDLVKKTKGIDVVFDEDMNDSKVYKLWSEGKSVGIFQFESAGMTSFMKELKPDGLEDIIAGVSLYRPGPMDQIPRYIRNKNNPDDIIYTHKSLEPILKVTYGCMVYQEQVMQIVRELAGYSLGRADLVRRAMSKKKLDVMAQERENFINGIIDENGNIEVPGCVRNGVDAKSANKIFDEMSEFAKYAFNKSHAAAYAVVSYQTAYLKTYYPVEFMAAMLNSLLGNLIRIPEYIYECKKMNIEILNPDINKSYTKFTVDDGKIRFGLASVKNVGINVINSICAEKEKNGEFKSFIDFCERVESDGVNKRCIESLIKAGAFDSFNMTRSTLIASYENIINSIQSIKKKNLTGQFSIFDLGQEFIGEDVKYNFVYQEEYTQKDLLAMEKEMLGIYISGHPLDDVKERLELQTSINSLKIFQIDENKEIETTSIYKDGQIVIYGGIITYKKLKATRNNEMMAFVSLEDLYGTVELVIFPSILKQYSNLFVENSMIIVKGRLSIREDENTKIVVQNVKKLQ